MAKEVLPNIKMIWATGVIKISKSYITILSEIKFNNLTQYSPNIIIPKHDHMKTLMRHLKIFLILNPRKFWSVLQA